MTLTYIFHSGFVLETEKSILIFDYCSLRWMKDEQVQSSEEKPRGFVVLSADPG